MFSSENKYPYEKINVFEKQRGIRYYVFREYILNYVFRLSPWQFSMHNLH